MNFRSLLRALLVAPSLLLLAGATHAQAPKSSAKAKPTPTRTPAPVFHSLGEIFSDKGELGLASVQDDAKAQSEATPFYKSNGVETRWFEGDFQAASDNSKLAILSDDGTSVWIGKKNVLERADQNQGFEHFDAVFCPLSFPFKAGHTYHVRLKYTNTIHSGDADVDGVTLFAYDGGGSLVTPNPTPTATPDPNATPDPKGTPDPTVTPRPTATPRPTRTPRPTPTTAPGQDSLTLESDKRAICAGGLFSSIHQAHLTATFKSGTGASVSGRTVHFSWRMPGASSDSSSDINIDPQGQAPLTLSSDTTGQILVTATCAGKTQSKTITVEQPQGNLDVTPKTTVVADGKNQFTLTLSLKFHNQPVEGHQISWKVTKVEKLVNGHYEEVSPDTQGNYAGYGGFTSSPPALVPTDASGKAVQHYTVGTLAGRVTFEAQDESVWIGGNSALSGNLALPEGARSAKQVGRAPPTGTSALPCFRRTRQMVWSYLLFLPMVLASSFLLHVM